jgi:hypothetical protein
MFSSFQKNVSPDEERNGPHTKMLAVYGLIAIDRYPARISIPARRSVPLSSTSTARARTELPGGAPPPNFCPLQTRLPRTPPSAPRLTPSRRPPSPRFCCLSPTHELARPQQAATRIISIARTASSMESPRSRPLAQPLLLYLPPPSMVAKKPPTNAALHP